jgi:ABC-type branched-subunit amino acid transport system permease subunit
MSTPTLSTPEVPVGTSEAAEPEDSRLGRGAVRDLAVAAVALLVLPFALDALGLTLKTAADVALMAVAVMGLNILVGHTGLVSFGHGAWFGIGAYGAAILQRHLVPGDMALPALGSLLIVAAGSLLAGALILRRRGVYFSLLTLALTAMLYAVAFRWTAVTGGESGFGGVSRWAVMDDPRLYYALVALVAFAVVWGLRRFHASPVGTVLVAIRENEDRARFLGYNVQRYKMVVCIVSAILTGLGGAIYPVRSAFATPDLLLWTESGEFIISVMIGGLGTLVGPVIGGAFFTLLRDKVSSYVDWYFIVIGLVLIVIVLFMPKGLLGFRRRLGFKQWRTTV